MGNTEHEVGDLVYSHENGFGWVEGYNEPKNDLMRKYKNQICWIKEFDIPFLGFSDEEVNSFKENLKEKLYANS